MQGLKKKSDFKLYAVLDEINNKKFGEKIAGLGAEVILLTIDSNGASKHQKHTQSAGKPASVSPGGNTVQGLSSSSHPASISKTADKFIKRCKNLVLKSSLYSLAREKLIIFKMNRYKKVALQTLDQYNPQAILCFSDRSHDYVESSILWAAKQKSVKVVIPYVAQFDIDSSLRYRTSEDGKPHRGLDASKYESIYAYFAKKRFKEQIYRDFYFQEPYMLTACYRTQTLSSFPWWIGNGNSDLVCVDSEHTKQSYLKYGVDASKLVVIGHVDYDSVYTSVANRAEVRTALSEKYDLDNTSEILLLSMPQYAEQGYVSWDIHFGKIRETLEQLQLSGKQVIVSLHPRSDPQQYQFVESEFKMPVISESLAEVIGAADLYLASNSTTFVWSVLCGVKTIALWSPVEFLYTHLKSIHELKPEEKLSEMIRQCLYEKQIDFEHDWKLLSKDKVFHGSFSSDLMKLLTSS